MRHQDFQQSWIQLAVPIERLNQVISERVVMAAVCSSQKAIMSHNRKKGNLQRKRFYFSRKTQYAALERMDT